MGYALRACTFFTKRWVHAEFSPGSKFTIPFCKFNYFIGFLKEMGKIQKDNLVKTVSIR